MVWQLLMELPLRLLDADRRAPEEWETLGRLLTQRQTQEDRLEGLADYLAGGTLDKNEYLRQKRRVRARLDELDDQITHVRAAAPRRRLRGATLQELWDEWELLGLDEKRAVLADHIDHIDVLPTGRGRRFTPDSIVIHWRD